MPVPGLEFTVAAVVAHTAESPLWYSVDMWSGREDAALMKVLADASNSALLTSLVAASRCWPPVSTPLPLGRGGFHPFGSPDPAGFAAMACDELLVHGDDAARGLGVAFNPDGRLAAGVLARLFPWHAPDSTMTPGNCCCGRTAASSCRGGYDRACGAGTAHRSPSGTAPAPSLRVVGVAGDVSIDSAQCAAPVFPRTINLFVYSVERRWTDSGVRAR